MNKNKDNREYGHINLSESDVGYARSVQQVEISKLQRLQDKVLAQQKGKICEILESKNKEVDNLQRELEDLGHDITEAQDLNVKIKDQVQLSNDNVGLEDDGIENIPQEEKLSRKKMMDIHDEMNIMRERLGELRKGMQLLERLKKDPGTNDFFIKKNGYDKKKNSGSKGCIVEKQRYGEDENSGISDLVMEEEGFNEAENGWSSDFCMEDEACSEAYYWDSEDLFLEGVRCSEEDTECAMKRMSFLSYHLKSLGYDEVNEKRARLSLAKEEHEELEQKLKCAKQCLADYDVEVLKAVDRDRIHIVQGKLISKRAELDNVHYEVQEALLRLEETKNCVQSRQDTNSDYVRKCKQVQDLLKQQQESIPMMMVQHDKLMKDLEDQFIELKSSFTCELEQLMPVIDKIKCAQIRLQKSEVYLKTAIHRKNILEREVSDMNDQIEKLCEDIQWAKKKEPSSEQNEKIDRELQQIENDTKIQEREQSQLMEKIKDVNFEIKKTDVLMQARQKEICRLKMMEKEFRVKLLEQFQQQLESK